MRGGSERKLAHTGERFVGCGDEWHILFLPCWGEFYGHAIFRLILTE